MVTALADYPDYTTVDNKHGTGSAGCHAAVESGSFDGDAPLGGLAEGVLLRMDGPDAVGCGGAVFVDHLFKLVSRFVTVGESRRSAYIAGNKDLVILGDDAARPAPVAGGSFGNSFANFHKILIPTGTTVRFHVFIVTLLPLLYSGTVNDSAFFYGRLNV